MKRELDEKQMPDAEPAKKVFKATDEPAEEPAIVTRDLDSAHFPIWKLGRPMDTKPGTNFGHFKGVSLKIAHCRLPPGQIPGAAGGAPGNTGDPDDAPPSPQNGAMKLGSPYAQYDDPFVVLDGANGEFAAGGEWVLIGGKPFYRDHVIGVLDKRDHHVFDDFEQHLFGRLLDTRRFQNLGPFPRYLWFVYFTMPEDEPVGVPANLLADSILEQLKGAWVLDTNVDPDAVMSAERDLSRQEEADRIEGHEKKGQHIWTR